MGRPDGAHLYPVSNLLYFGYRKAVGFYIPRSRSVFYALYFYSRIRYNRHNMNNMNFIEGERVCFNLRSSAWSC